MSSSASPSDARTDPARRANLFIGAAAVLVAVCLGVLMLTRAEPAGRHGTTGTVPSRSATLPPPP